MIKKDTSLIKLVLTLRPRMRQLDVGTFTSPLDCSRMLGSFIPLPLLHGRSLVTTQVPGECTLNSFQINII